MTTINKDAWQERLTTRTTVPASEVVQAVEAIRGLAGSWAAAYAFDLGVRSTTAQNSSAPSPILAKTSKLGQPGFPEINFAPYSHGTNRFGTKGGSFIGHPISFSPVGPTGKHSDVVWRWKVTDNSGEAEGDILEMEDQTLNEQVTTLYGIEDATSVYFPGGLYVVISQTGDPGLLGSSAGGLGDGYLRNQAAGDVPLTPADSTSKYEIFRVISLDRVTRTKLTLDPAKRLADYFTIAEGPDVPYVDKIMLLQPQATRLVAVPTPGETKGAEQTFAVVPPPRALNTDEQYPLNQWKTATWQEDAFPNHDLAAGTDFEYTNKPLTPLAKPTGKSTLWLYGTAGDTAAEAIPAGRFAVLERYGDSARVGDIIRVHDVNARGDAVMNPDSGTGRRASLDTLLGYFEVMELFTGGYYVRRMEEMSPDTGQMFVGSWPSLCQEGTPSNTSHIELQVTIHSSVSSLWTGTYYDVTELESVRLRNLIDPSQVKSTAKVPEDTLVTSTTRLLGQSKGRADRAVFDTSSTNSGVANSNADPGNLLDLGFRMVLYPAVARTETINPAGDTAILTAPDWDRPIKTNEVVLDPSKPEEKQYIEVDYSNGMVHLSHVPTEGSDVWPGDMTDVTDNPRGELVLFACCVPYSQEEGQMGTGVRATASAITGVPDQCVPDPVGGADQNQTDAFSTRLCYPLIAQTITTNHDGTGTITLSGEVKDNIPMSGFIDILAGTTPLGEPLFADYVNYTNWRGTTFGYSGVAEVGGNTLLYNVYGGGQTGNTFDVTVAAPAVAVWRRDVTLPQDSRGDVGTPYQYDTTYGGAKRSGVLRFEDTTLRANADGSTTVIPNQSKAEANQALMGDLFSSWVLSGLQVSTHTSEDVNYIYCPYTTGTILMRGVYQTVPASTVAIPREVGTNYVYLNSTSGNICVTAQSQVALPLPDPEDILLAKVTVTVVGEPSTTVVTDLRYFLRDVDRRADIYVGEYADGWDASFQPHFKTLKAAIDYVNELGAPTAGSSIQTFRIRVVGRTVESDPISIGVDGLVVEGALQADGAAPFPEICWSRDDDLIDLAGHNDIVFRNVPFRYTGSATPTGKYVFTDSVGSNQNLVIEHCVARGYVDGLIHSEVAETINARITHNTVPEAYITGVYGYFKGCTIQHNIITAAAGIPEDLAAIQLTSLSGDAWAGNTTSHNITTGFKHGVLDQSRGSRVETNYVVDSTNIGIVGEGLASISYNYCSNVFTTDPTTSAMRVGLYAKIPAAPTPATQVVGNYVVMTDDFDPLGGTAGNQAYRAAILVEAVSGASASDRNPLVVGNHCLYNPASPTLAPMLILGDHVVVESNPCDIVVWGGGNKLVANSSNVIYVNYDVYHWWYNDPSQNGEPGGDPAPPPTTPNTLIGNTTITAAALSYYTIAQGNVFGGTGTIGIGTYVASLCQLTGNKITHLKDFEEWETGFVLVTGVGLHGNNIVSVGEDNLGATDNIWPGLKTKAVGNDWDSDVVLSGGYLLLDGNSFDQSLSCTAASNSLICNNRVGDPISNDNTTFTVIGGLLKVANNLVMGKDSVTGTLTFSGGYSQAVGNTFIQGGTLGGTVTVSGLSASVQGNQAQNLVGTSIYQAAITGNTMLDGITLSGNNLTVTGNTVTNTDGFIQTSHGATYKDIAVVGNKAEIINVYTSETSATGNVCLTMNVGNGADDITRLAVEGNVVEDDIIFNGVSELTVLGNVLPSGGKITLNDDVYHFTVQGNRSQELQIDGDFGAINGNLVWYANGTDALTLGGGNLTVGGNFVWGNMVLSRVTGYTTVSANRIYSNDEATTESNIRIEKDGSYTPDGLIVTDNFVNGQILLWDTVAGAGISPPQGGWYYVVRNNRATEIFETVITLKQLPVPADIDVENILSS